MEIALGVLCLVLLGVVVALVVGLVRTHRQLADARATVAQLESDLATALRPPPPSGPAERAVQRVIKTASKVRERGIAGLVQSTVEGLQSWAHEERAEIVHMAASDGTVTLFFSDIENSTALNARLGDASWVKVLAAHDQLVRARIAQYRGQVVKTAGDGFMAAFRDAEAACRAGVGIQKDLRKTVDPTLRRHPVKVRIGIHTGQVVAREGDYFGANVAMAARVADLAPGGQVLASDPVRAALDDDAAVELVDPVTAELRGLPGEHTVWRVAGRRT